MSKLLKILLLIKQKILTGLIFNFLVLKFFYIIKFVSKLNNFRIITKNIYKNFMLIKRKVNLANSKSRIDLKFGLALYIL